MSNTPQHYEGVESVSERTGIPVKTLYNLKWRGEGPPVYKVGRRLLFIPAEVDAWIAGHGRGADAA